MDPAIFLDRDGVIIQNRPDYVRSWAQVYIYKQAISALKILRDTPYQIIIVTNQSAVGRGILPLDRAQEINRRLIKEIQRAGGRIDAIYMCPHAPEDGCTCRKPAPGLLNQASTELKIDLSRSIMVGDALTDIQAGQAAGVEKTGLVLTGRGKTQIRLVDREAIPGVGVYRSLLDFSKSLQ